MEDVREYLHLYLGCDFRIESHWLYQNLVGNIRHNLTYANLIDNQRGQVVIKPILRRLDSMTEEECRHLAWFNLDSEKHLDADSRVTTDEIDMHIVHGDGGLMVDADAAIVMDVSCRCFEGQVCVRTNGDIELWNDAGEKLPIERQAENVRWLLSKGFWLFGDEAFDKGLIIDSKTLNKEV